jgi:hypothetical protein
MVRLLERPLFYNPPVINRALGIRKLYHRVRVAQEFPKTICRPWCLRLATHTETLTAFTAGEFTPGTAETIADIAAVFAAQAAESNAVARRQNSRRSFDQRAGTGLMLDRWMRR